MSMPMIHYEKELNPEQLKAVRSTEGPYLLIAGAGSGKTRVLVYRTAFLVEKDINPEHILLLTFTRRAAREMLERASKLLDDRCQKVSGGTFHSFANMVLRKYGERIALKKNFTILDETDSQSAIGFIRKRDGFGKDDKRFPKRNTLKDIISKSINKAADIETILYEEYPRFVEYALAIAQIKEKYNHYKKELHALDFDDLLTELKRLLDKEKELAAELSCHYRYIMVDEYQDTNKIQAEIVETLCVEHQNIMVVGDDAQSIYSFRGAHFENIIKFPKTFPTAEVIKLQQNYRSSQPILDLTNEVIASAAQGFQKNLFTEIKGKRRPIYVDTTTENSQSQYIVRKILDLLAGGVKLTDMAVLFRTGWHSNDLEMELSKNRIPFVKYGGKKFVESAHIKDILSFLSVLSNPSHEVGWLRVLMMLPGVGQKTALSIAKNIIQTGWDIPEKFYKKNDRLKSLLKVLKEIDCIRQPPSEILNKVLDFYFPYFAAEYDDYDKRMKDFESLMGIITRYATLEEFLSDVTLDPVERSVVEAQGPFTNSHLTLSTIHSAKGLEWHTVFLIHLAEGFLPSYQSMENVEALEEERRLFYVAATRAKKNLFLLRPQINSRPALDVKMDFDADTNQYTRLSRFLAEERIMQELVEIHTDYSEHINRTFI